MKAPLRIGTRASPLALAMTDMFIADLHKHHHGYPVEVVKIITSGDKNQAANVSLSAVGGKGLFTKEIEEALSAGVIDCAMHSMKDMPTHLPDGLCITALMPRGDVRDAFFSPKAKTLDDLPKGAVIGTSSLRRQSIVLARRPDLKVVTFRGNVDTRLQKLADGVVDATLLAVSGLERLGKAQLIQHILEPDVMLPAVAQGAIGIEARIDDKATRALLAPVHCKVTELRVTAERAFLDVMDGSCKTPLAALMGVPDASGKASFDVLVARPDGSDVKRASYRETVLTLAEAEALGRRAGMKLKTQLPAGYF